MEIFNRLSTPFEGDFAALTAELATHHFRLFCVQASNLAKEHGYGPDARVVEIIQRLAQRPASTAYWTPEVSVLCFGLLKRPLSEGGWNWMRAQIALAAHLTGVTTELELDVETNAPLIVCGQVIPAARLVIRGGSDRLTLQTEGAASPRSFSVIARRNGSPVWVEDGTAASFVHIDGQPAIRVVNDYWQSTWSDGCEAGLSRPLATVEHQAAIAQFQEAFALLDRFMPQYRAWVFCLLREITPMVRPAPSMTASGSSHRRFGGVDLCVPASPLETVELLIHECSHQYYHLAHWVGSLVTPEAKSYYSPIKRRERPLDRILMGYHAYGNVLIAFDQLRAAGFEKELSKRSGEISTLMVDLRVPVENEVGLSQLGLALSRPLHSRLTQGRLVA
ncbi:MAG TPA: HEXXH motif-containing putative peptide modification protein [Archangium sp.]|nr:HEXXH motif-containing putative peptide modification protein [Archangium sp.]